MRYTVLIFIILLSCSSKKQVLEQDRIGLEAKPSWIDAKPISGLEYIGVGRAMKNGTPDEYQAIAKQNALQDLASEIEVHVSTNSMLYTLEHDDRFSETYTQAINTQSDILLEGFEAYDSYQDAEEYWVMYRLSKRQYQRIKEERKLDALKSAEQVLETARALRGQGDISSATRMYIVCLDELRPYWGEENSTAFEESLDRTALEELFTMRNSFQIVSDHMAIRLNEENDFRVDLNLHATVDGSNLNQALWTYSYLKGEQTEIISDHLNLSVRPVDPPHTTLSIKVDPFRDLRKEYRGTAYTFLVEVLKAEYISIQVNTDLPSFEVKITHKNIEGSTSPLNELKSVIISRLASAGVATNMNDSSRYLISLESVSRKGGEAQGFQIVYVDAILSIIDRLNGEVIDSHRFESIKGVHNDKEKAEQAALKKLEENLKKTLLNELIINAL